MFRPIRAQTIANIGWSKVWNESSSIQALDVWSQRQANGQITSIPPILHEISESTIPEWIQDNRSRPSAAIGRLRLLICSRPRGEVYKLSIPITQQSYEAIEHHFDLHPSTMPAFFNLNGICAIYPIRDTTSTKMGDNTTGFSIVIKATEKIQSGTWALSLRHDLRTCLTQGFLLCEHLLEGQWERYILENRIEEIIRESIQSSGHYIIQSGERYVVSLEEAMGLTRVGVLARDIPWSILNSKTVRQAQNDAFSLLVSLSTRLTEISFMIRVSEWQKDCINCIKKAINQQPQIAEIDEASAYIIDIIQYLESAVQNLADFNENHRCRIQLQLNTTQIYTSQIDNSLNAHLAETAGHDSVSMKTLSVVTTIFLPATFVATMFSMSTFSWMAGETDGKVVSHRYWIYWVTTISLGTVVFVIWYLWQRVEHKRYYNRVWEEKIDFANLPD